MRGRFKTTADQSEEARQRRLQDACQMIEDIRKESGLRRDLQLAVDTRQLEFDYSKEITDEQ